MIGTWYIDFEIVFAFCVLQYLLVLLVFAKSLVLFQADKVESFKRMPIKENALHAKYDITNGATCVADHLWGHLQVDATSLYILMLAQMTTSGMLLFMLLMNRKGLCKTNQQMGCGC